MRPPRGASGISLDWKRAAARVSELEAVRTGAAQLRIFASNHSPLGMGELAAPPVPDAVHRDGHRLLAAAEQTEQAAIALAGEQMGYQLVARNCVSELFGTIELAMRAALRERGESIEASALERETTRRLGGVVKPGPIPFVLVGAGSRVLAGRLHPRTPLAAARNRSAG